MDNYIIRMMDAAEAWFEQKFVQHFVQHQTKKSSCTTHVQQQKHNKTIQNSTK